MVALTSKDYSLVAQNREINVQSPQNEETQLTQAALGGVGGLATILKEKDSGLKLSGNEVYYTA
jgi:hypothetical protein